MSARNPRWSGEADRIAIVLPGIGYTPDMPLLYWTAKTLHRDGWTVQQVWWPEPLPTDHDQMPGWVTEQTVEAVDAQPSDARILLVGKSLGTFAMPLAAERSLPGIWLTPLLAHVPELTASLDGLPSALLVGGTADQTWDSQAAARSAHRVCEVEGADHAVEVQGEPAASLVALARVVTAVGEYAGALRGRSRV